MHQLTLLIPPPILVSNLRNQEHALYYDFLVHVQSTLVQANMSIPHRVQKVFEKCPQLVQESKLKDENCNVISVVIPVTRVNFLHLLELDRFYNGQDSELYGLFDRWIPLSCSMVIVLASAKKNKDDKDGQSVIFCKPVFDNSSLTSSVSNWLFPSKKKYPIDDFKNHI